MHHALGERGQKEVACHSCSLALFAAKMLLIPIKAVYSNKALKSASNGLSNHVDYIWPNLCCATQQGTMPLLSMTGQRIPGGR